MALGGRSDRSLSVAWPYGATYRHRLRGCGEEGVERTALVGLQVGNDHIAEGLDGDERLERLGRRGERGPETGLDQGGGFET